MSSDEINCRIAVRTSLGRGGQSLYLDETCLAGTPTEYRQTYVTVASFQVGVGALVGAWLGRVASGSEPSNQESDWARAAYEAYRLRWSKLDTLASAPTWTELEEGKRRGWEAAARLLRSQAAPEASAKTAPESSDVHPVPLTIGALPDFWDARRAAHSARFVVASQPPAVAPQLPAADNLNRAKNAHYYKDVSHLNEVDVYRVLELFAVADPCLQHAIKKLLVPGDRAGGKNRDTDIQDAIHSLKRYQEMRAEDRKP